MTPALIGTVIGTVVRGWRLASAVAAHGWYKFAKIATRRGPSEDGGRVASGYNTDCNVSPVPVRSLARCGYVLVELYSPRCATRRDIGACEEEGRTRASCESDNVHQYSMSTYAIEPHIKAKRVHTSRRRQHAWNCGYVKTLHTRHRTIMAHATTGYHGMRCPSFHPPPAASGYFSLAPLSLWSHSRQRVRGLIPPLPVSDSPRLNVLSGFTRCSRAARSRALTRDSPGFSFVTLLRSRVCFDGGMYLPCC